MAEEIVYINWISARIHCKYFILFLKNEEHEVEKGGSKAKKIKEKIEI